MPPILVRRGVNLPTNASVPAAPTNFVATATGSDQIDWSWDDNANNETGYRVERSPNGTDSWVTADTLPPGAESGSESGLSTGTEYFYRVIAFNANGDSAPSNVDNATTQGYVYATYAAACASGDSWPDGETIYIGASEPYVEFKYFTSIDLDGHCGLIPKYPNNDSREVASVTVLASEPTNVSPTSWTDYSVTAGGSTTVDTFNGRARMSETLSGEVLVRGPSGQGDNNSSNDLLFQIVDAATGVVGPSESCYVGFSNYVSSGNRGFTGIATDSNISANNWVYTDSTGTQQDTGIDASAENRFFMFADTIDSAYWQDADLIATGTVRTLPALNAPIGVRYLPGATSGGRILQHGYHIIGRYTLA